MNFTQWVQTRLEFHGFNPGAVDGAYGRRTRNALIAFQRENNLSPNGNATAETVAKLRTSALPNAAPKRELPEEFPWMGIGLRKKGLHENRDNTALREFLKSDGHALGDPAKLPWCGDFVETCLALALPEEALPINPYMARNWLKFGKESAPTYGAVLVFERPGSAWSGHVCFYCAEDATHFHVLGGNQSDSISVTRIARNRLLDARMPLTGGPYRAIKRRVDASGDVSTNEA